MAERCIDLENGQPLDEAAPNDVILTATQHLFSTPLHFDGGTSAPLAYGDYTQRYRAELAAFLARADPSRHEVDPDRLLPTAGISQALDQICTIYTETGDIVLVEEPSYFLAFGIFRNHSLDVRGVSTDAYGVEPADLKRVIEEISRPHGQGRKAVFLYLVPTFNNPTGRTMPLERRQEIVDIAKEHDMLIIADEVYHLLTWGQSPVPPSLATLGDNVISVSSFSKILAPGLRVGWMEGAPSLIERLGGWAVIDSGGSVCHFTSSIVASCLELRLVDTHLLQLKATYHDRASTLFNTLQKELPSGCYVEPADGGYFLWVQLPLEVDAKQLLADAEPAFKFKPGAAFSPGGDKFHNFARLCFARLDLHDLEEGAHLFSEAVRACLGR